MKLYIVRHGQTDANKNGISSGGQSDDPINETGRKQASKVGERLKEEKFDIVIVSPLSRTKETAEAILKFHSNEPIFDKRIREKDYGEFEGLLIQDFTDYLERTNQDRYLTRPEGGENLEDFQKRLFEFLDEIKEKHSDKSILLVTHGGVLKNLGAKIMNKGYKEMPPSHNCSLTIFNIEDNKVEVEKYDCVEHLE